MAWDFTLSTGNKSGRSRRSSGSNAARPTSSVNQTSTPEATIPMAEIGESALTKAAGAFGDFFGNMSQVETAKEMKVESAKNDEAIKEASRRVLADPEGANEAIKTGDYSNFIDDDELRSRKSVQEGFMSSVGGVNGMDAWETEGKAFIAALGPEANPDEAYGQWLAQRVEGTSPVYADSFMRAGMRSGAKTITQWRDSRTKYVNEQATQAFRGVTSRIFKDTSMPRDFEVIEGQVMAAAGGLAIPHPQKLKMAREAIGKAAMQNSATNRAAYDYATTTPVDPLNPNSLTIAEDSALKGTGSLAEYADKTNAGNREELGHNAQKRLTNLEALAKTQPQMAHSGLVDLIMNKGADRLNPRVDKLWKELSKQIGAQQGNNLLADVWRNSGTNIASMSADQIAKVKKAREGIPFDQLKAAANALGISEQEVMRAEAMMRQHGMSPSAEQKRFAQQMLSANTKDQEAALQEFQSFKAMTDTGNGRALFPKGAEGEKAFAIASFASSHPKVTEKFMSALQKFTGNFDNPWIGEGTTKTLMDHLSSKSDTSYLMDSTPEFKTNMKSAAAILYIGLGSWSTDSFNSTLQEMYPEDGPVIMTSKDGKPLMTVPSNDREQWRKDQMDAMDVMPNNFYPTGVAGELGGVRVADDVHGQDQIHLPNTTESFATEEEIPPYMRPLGKIIKNADGTVTMKFDGAPADGEPLIRKSTDAANDNTYSAWVGSHWQVVMSETDLTKRQEFTGPQSKRLSQLLGQRKSLQADLDKGAEEAQGQRGIRAGATRTRGADLQKELARTETTINKMIKQQASTNAAILNTLKSHQEAFGGGPFLSGAISKLEATNEPTVQGKTDEEEQDASVKKIQSTIHTDLKEQQKVNHDVHKDPEFTYTKDIESFFIEHEGITPTSYADTNKATSVGIGFNLDNGDVQAMVREYGFSVKNLKNKSEVMRDSVSKRILKDLYKQKRERLIDMFTINDWVELGDNEMLALVSMYYNASSTITPSTRIYASIKALAESRRTEDTELEEAAIGSIQHEIRNKSLPVAKMLNEGNGQSIDGLWYRRNSEADKFLGMRIWNADDTIKYPTRENNWRDNPVAKELAHRNKKGNRPNKADPLRYLYEKKVTRQSKTRLNRKKK